MSVDDAERRNEREQLEEHGWSCQERMESWPMVVRFKGAEDNSDCIIVCDIVTVVTPGNNTFTRTMGVCGDCRRVQRCHRSARLPVQVLEFCPCAFD